MRSAHVFDRVTHASACITRLPQLQFLHASFVAIGLLLDSSASAQTTTTYAITDLGTLPGFDAVEVSGINASGQVVGTAKNFTTTRAFVYTSGRGLTDLGTLGGTWSYGDAINVSGQATGVFDSKTGGHAYVYTPGTGMTDLGSLTGPSGSSRGFAINTSGQIAGEDNISRAFIYTPGVGMTMIALPGNLHHSAARAINDAGQVTGYFSTDGGAVQRPFLYTPGQGVADLRALTGKPLVGGFAINSKGQVTGSTDTGAAFVYTPGAGAIILEGTNGGNAINSLGHVVGGSSATTGYPFLYKPGEQLINLNNVLPAGSGWVLHTANGINDAGQITGTGRNPDRQIRAFLLLARRDHTGHPESAGDLSAWLVLGSQQLGNMKRLLEASGITVAEPFDYSALTKVPSIGGTGVPIEQIAGVFAGHVFLTMKKYNFPQVDIVRIAWEAS